MSKHTPGPWRYFLEGNGTRFHITARPATKPGNSFDDFATVDIRHEADAQLMALAPELLAQLKHMVRLWEEAIDRQPEYMPMANSARAAIAKAEGKEAP